MGPIKKLPVQTGWLGKHLASAIDAKSGSGKNAITWCAGGFNFSEFLLITQVSGTLTYTLARRLIGGLKNVSSDRYSISEDNVCCQNTRIR